MVTNIRNQFSKWQSVKVKARFNFTCAECGSTENIQAHDPTKTHSDWYSGIALCGDCHSRKHPNIPKKLFIKKHHQPMWPNISASSLAKKLCCHNRTIIRRAQKLGIPFGMPLTEEHIQLLRDYPRNNTNSSKHASACSSTNIAKIGKIPTCQGHKQRYRCNDCGRTFYVNDK